MRWKKQHKHLSGMVKTRAGSTLNTFISAQLQRKCDAMSEEFDSLYQSALYWNRDLEDAYIGDSTVKSQVVIDMYEALSASQAREAELEQRVKVLVKGLNALNYTASENSPNACIVRELLRQTPQQTAAQIERWHVEWMMKLKPVAHAILDQWGRIDGGLVDSPLPPYPANVGVQNWQPLVAIPPLPKESKE